MVAGGGFEPPLAVGFTHKKTGLGRFLNLVAGEDFPPAALPSPWCLLAEGRVDLIFQGSG